MVSNYSKMDLLIMYVMAIELMEGGTCPSQGICMYGYAHRMSLVGKKNYFVQQPVPNCMKWMRFFAGL
jgi:hypothetical protein